MAKPTGMFNKGRARGERRKEILGAKGTAKQLVQDSRNRLRAVGRGILKGDVTTAVNRQNTRDAIRHVGNYKAAMKKKNIKKPYYSSLAKAVREQRETKFKAHSYSEGDPRKK